MSSAKDPAADGRCRCSEVRFRVTGAPLLTAACHCTGCQRMSASAFSLSSVYPVAAFEVAAGEPVIGGMHGATRHYFCPNCMSWMFSRPEGMDDIVVVRSSMLDHPPAAPPFVDLFRSEGFSWAATGAAHSFETSPGAGGFAPLLAGFAATSTKEATP